MFGIDIQVSEHMIGAKKAILFGEDRLVVSPAMFDLIQNAKDEKELRFLIANLPITRIPELPSIS